MIKLKNFGVRYFVALIALVVLGLNACAALPNEAAVTAYVTSATAIATAVALLVLGVAGFYFMKGFLNRKR